MSIDEKTSISAQSIISPKDQLFVHGLRVGTTSQKASGRLRVISNPVGNFTVTIGKRTETISPDVDIVRTAEKIKQIFDTTSDTQPPCAATLTVTGAQIAIVAHQMGAEGNTVALATNSSDIQVSAPTLLGGCSSIDGFCSLGGLAFENRPEAPAEATIDVTRRPTSSADSVDITVGGTTIAVPSRNETLSGVQATAEIVFTDKPNEGDTIIIRDSSGTNVTFEIDDSEDGVTGSNVAITEIQENGSGSVGTAADFIAKVNATSSLGVTASAGGTTSTVVLTQDATGSAGNTTISADSSFDSTTSALPTRFKNGVTGAVAATATFTFSDKPTEGSTITLEDRDRNVATFEVDNENNGVGSGNIALNGIAAAGSGATGTAADLVAKINASSLKITAANPSSGVVTLTQDEKGTAGNTTIRVNTVSDWNASTSVNVPTAFTGGIGQGGNSRAEFLNQATQKINSRQASLIGDSFTGLKVLQSPDIGDAIVFNIPSAVGGAGTNITVNFEALGRGFSPGANTIAFRFSDGETTATTAARLRDMINGVGSGRISEVDYGSGAGTTSAGIAGISAFDGATTGAVNIFVDSAGTGGNSATMQVTTGVGRLAGLGAAYQFTGGRTEDLKVTATNDGVSRLTITSNETGLAANSTTLTTNASSDLSVVAFAGGSAGQGFTNATSATNFGGAEFTSSGSSNENLNIRSTTGDTSLQGARFASGASGAGSFRLLNNPSTSFVLTVNGTAHTITPGASGPLTLQAAKAAIDAGAQSSNFTTTFTTDQLVLTSKTAGSRLNEVQFSSNTTDIVAENNGTILGGSTLIEKSSIRGEVFAQAKGSIRVLQDAVNAIVISFPGPASIQYDMKPRGSVAQMCTDLAAQINSPKAALLGSTLHAGVSIDGPTGDGSERYVITIPAKAGGRGTAITLKFLTSLSGSPAANTVEVVCAGGASNATVADRVKLAINGSGGDSNIAYGTGGGTTSAGIAGLTATDGPADTLLDLQVANDGVAGNSATFVASSTRVSGTTDSQSFFGGGYAPVVAVAGSDSVTLTAAQGTGLRNFAGSAGNSITVTTGDATKMAVTTALSGGTSGPVVSNTETNFIEINGIGFARGTTTPGAYPIKSNPQILCPGVSQLLQFNLSFDNFNDVSATSLGIPIISVPNIPLLQHTGIGMVIQDVLIYKATPFTSSAGGTITVQVGTRDKDDLDFGDFIGADSLIRASDVTSSGNTVIGLTAAEKGMLLSTGPSAVLLEGTSAEKIFVTLTVGSGNLTNLTAGSFQVILRYWSFPTLT